MLYITVALQKDITEVCIFLSAGEDVNVKPQSKMDRTQKTEELKIQ